MATPLEEAFALLRNARPDEVRIVRLPGSGTRIEIIPRMTTTVPRQAQRPSKLPTITVAERKRLLDSLPEDQGEEDSEAWVQTITAARIDTDRAVFPD
jgi:hypothetical protein